MNELGVKAAIYARVSTAAQGEEDKASISEQIERIKKYCLEKGYTIVDYYIDIGYSGAKSRRPEFQRMLADAKAPVGRSTFERMICSISWRSGMNSDIITIKRNGPGSQ